MIANGNGEAWFSVHRKMAMKVPSIEVPDGAQ